MGEATNGDTDLELVVFSADDDVRTFALPPAGEVTIGRGETNTIRIDDPAVSRNHAVLHVGAGLKIQDLGSANGTVVRSKGGAVAPAGDTMNVRQLFQRDAVFAVGDSLLFGTTCVVVRHRPSAGIAGPTAAKPGAVVRDQAMRLLYEQVTLVARASTQRACILGETGVGQGGAGARDPRNVPPGRRPVPGHQLRRADRVAAGERAVRPREGSVHGRRQRRGPGLFETAEGGTVFLDEIGELPPGDAGQAAARARGARADARRVDASRARRRPLRRRHQPRPRGRGAAGRFREDLFFRLERVSLLIPPLRERPEEIELLAQRFLVAAPARSSRRPPALAPRARDLLPPTAGPATCASCAT